MTADRRIILRDLGLILHVPGLMAVASLPVAWIFGELWAVGPLLATAVASIVPGQVLFRLWRDAGETRLHHGVKVAALAWMALPLIGAVPFVGASAAGPDGGGGPQLSHVWDCVFEAFSGFTGTGLTLAPRPHELPRVVQWWRSFSQWVGGVGVIMVMLSILRPAAGLHRLYFSEGREVRIRPDVRGTVRTVWWILAAYSAASALLFRVLGMPWWEAINHGLTGVATGGFTITANGFADYPAAIRLAAMPVMAVGAVSFAVHHRVVRGEVGALWRDPQSRTLWLLLLGGGLVLWADNVLVLGGEISWVDGGFHWVSALATAGFQSVDLRGWSPAGKLMLVLAMVIGGAAGSTVGGIKLIRVVLLWKGMRWRLRRVTRSRHEVPSYRFEGVGLDEREAFRRVDSAALLTIAWIASLWVGVMVLVHVAPAGYDLSDVIFEAASAQGNVGLSSGITHPDLHWAGKLMLIVSMYAGRLEILPLLVFAIPSGR